MNLQFGPYIYLYLLTQGQGATSFALAQKPDTILDEVSLPTLTKASNLNCQPLETLDGLKWPRQVEATISHCRMSFSEAKPGVAGNGEPVNLAEITHTTS